MTPIISAHDKDALLRACNTLKPEILEGHKNDSLSRDYEIALREDQLVITASSTTVLANIRMKAMRTKGIDPKESISNGCRQSNRRICTDLLGKLGITGQQLRDAAEEDFSQQEQPGNITHSTLTGHYSLPLGQIPAHAWEQIRLLGKAAERDTDLLADLADTNIIPRISPLEEAKLWESVPEKIGQCLARLGCPVTNIQRIVEPAEVPIPVRYRMALRAPVTDNAIRQLRNELSRVAGTVTNGMCDYNIALRAIRTPDFISRTQQRSEGAGMSHGSSRMEFDIDFISKRREDGVVQPIGAEETSGLADALERCQLQELIPSSPESKGR